MLGKSDKKEKGLGTGWAKKAQPFGPRNPPEACGVKPALQRRRALVRGYNSRGATMTREGRSTRVQRKNPGLLENVPGLKAPDGVRAARTIQTDVAADGGERRGLGARYGEERLCVHVLGPWSGP